MIDQSSGFRDDEAIAEGMRAAVLGEEEDFTAALYGLELIGDPEFREMVRIYRDDSAGFIRSLREKLEVSECEVVSQRRQGSSLVIHLCANGALPFEAVVDDLHEEDGRLLTRDLIKLRLLDPFDEENNKATPAA